MKILRIVFNNGMSEGYFIETRLGFIQVNIMLQQALQLKNIKSMKEVRINQATLKVEDIESNDSYIR